VFYIDTPSGHGTGWLLEPGLIVTAEHVISGHAHATVRQSSATHFTASVLAFDSQRDVALLAYAPSGVTLSPSASPLPLGDISSADSGAPLMALGYSNAGVKADGTVGGASANVGVLSQITAFPETTLGLNLEMDVPVDPGDSGGPILDRHGNVVGMSRAQVSGNLGTFYAVSIDEIRNALPALKRGDSR
jgi:S1-C subfamily serine protease